MATYSRNDEAGNTLVLKAGDRRSAASKRIRTIEKTIAAELGIKRLTEALRVLCRNVAELTFVGEELSDQLVTGKPISVELMGRNADRLQRTMKELREQAIGVRLRERQLQTLNALEDDDDEEGSEPKPRASRPRARVGIETVIIDPRRSP